MISNRWRSIVVCSWVRQSRRKWLICFKASSSNRPSRLKVTVRSSPEWVWGNGRWGVFVGGVGSVTRADSRQQQHRGQPELISGLRQRRQIESACETGQQLINPPQSDDRALNPFATPCGERG